MRHCASVKVQPQLQVCALNLWSATVFCSGVSLLRSTPGSSLARSAFFRKICPVSSKVSTFTLPMERPRSDRIVDAEFFNKILDGILIVVVHDQAEDLESVFIFVLQLDEIRDFSAARSAPGGPEIQKNHFSARIRERDRLAVEATKLEFRRGIGVAHKTDRALLVG